MWMTSAMTILPSHVVTWSDVSTPEGVAAVTDCASTVRSLSVRTIRAWPVLGSCDCTELPTAAMMPAAVGAVGGPVGEVTPGGVVWAFQKRRPPSRMIAARSVPQQHPRILPRCAVREATRATPVCDVQPMLERMMSTVPPTPRRMTIITINTPCQLVDPFPGTMDCGTEARL